MKNKTILFSLFGFAFLFLTVSCDKDDTTAPVITILSPTNNFESFGDLPIMFNITENEGLDNYELKVVDLSDGSNLYIENEQVSGKNLAVDKVLNIDFPRTDNYELIISATDINNNFSTETLIISGKATAKLALNIKLQYDGEPMIVFNEYTYPELDFTFFLTRVSMYISNVQPVGSDFSEPIENIGLLRLEEAHDEASAALGYTYILPMAEGNFESIQFGLGVPPEQNAMRPADFPIENPLSKSGEYWDSWSSYIFTKIEGKADINGDPNDFSEELIALHMGGNEAFRAITLNQSGTLTEGQTTTIEIVLDMKDFFFQNGEVYDLAEDGNRQIHSILQMDLVTDLSDRFAYLLNNQ
ncbi:MAG: hypothetical protein NXI23_11150 [Bacteroidetes bacterium]|nr:hypothetical protein [Bacteroidota bacterium]